MEEFQRILESYDVQARAQWETDEDRQQNNKIFTSTICTLFKILSSWPTDAASIRLSIQAKSPSDSLDMKQRRKQAARSRVDDLLYKRYERSCLQFSRITTDVECLPVPIVTHLSIQGLGNERLIEPASTAVIASKLPQLNRVELLMRDGCKRDERLRQQLRNDFARNLYLFPARYYDPLNVIEDGSDLLSSCLRDLSQRLEILNIKESTVLGPELFWPSSSQEDTLPVNRPFWQNLRDVTVSYAPVTPSGKWLLERDPEKTDPTEDNTDPEYYDTREEQYPESVRIPPEDRRSIYFRSKIIASYADRFYILAAWAAL
ncbi:uncharacterized protein N7458_002572 [Penicillium daleae]|uniref:Uncharacterized protein n=1 Tax=Penicillium daleae TaxID=63821 RepID=A0AAD6G6W5_9EURO|nr:uncharacterized protein N7458_002572 [Penicillium daleae]KAJ5461020.1 hypothetical protein N7458_002572 [Penicillium daleae]